MVYADNYNKESEQLVRRVKVFGNGAHISVPRDWIEQEVILIKKPKKSVKERIFSVIGPYLENIIGVYIYGSYSRGEENQDSDIDLLIIVNKKIKIKAKGFEIHCIEESKFDKIIKLEPLIIYSMLSEAKVIINPKLLEELREKYKPKISNFKDFIESSKRMINISKELLEADKSESDYSSKAVPYSLVLRLRGIFIINSLSKNKNYSYKEFKEWVKKNLPEIEFNKIYELYLSSKNKKETKIKVKTDDLVKLLEFLEKEVRNLDNGKKTKKA